MPLPPVSPASRRGAMNMVDFKMTSKGSPARANCLRAGSVSRVALFRCMLTFLTLWPLVGHAQNVTTVLNAGGCPLGVAVNPVTNKIYVANNCSNNVTVIDGATNSSTAVNAGPSPSAVAVNPMTNRVYVGSNLSSANNVTVIDGATNSTTTVT